MSERNFIVTMIALFGGFIGAIVISEYLDNQKDIEMAKLGLQQCIVVKPGTIDVVHKIWQKECKNEKI